MRHVLRSARVDGRRHLPKLLYLLAIPGVPVAVVLATGGGRAIGLWIVTGFWVAAVAYAAMVAGFIVLLALAPFLLLAERFFPGRVEPLVGRVAKPMLVVFAGAGFLRFAQIPEAGDVRLPVAGEPGALIVLVVGWAACYGLFRLARRLRVPASGIPAHERRHSVAEPEEVFWSHQPVVGWRAWNWDGRSLRGVYSAWGSEIFEATCRHCDVVPSWDHVCGVYAAKSPDGVHSFHGGSWIVGRVEMWGDVIEHENGYRAAHARITDLWVGDPWRAQHIESAYPAVDVKVGRLLASEEVW